MARATRYSAIGATGNAVGAVHAGDKGLSIQNVGTVAIEVYYNADGTGDPFVILAGGAANDDGKAAHWFDDEYDGPVWLKAPAGGGRAIVGEL